jgi:hypothetical protein
MRKHLKFKQYRHELQREYQKVYRIIKPLYQRLVPLAIRHRHNYQHLVVSDVEIIATTILGQLHHFSSQLKWYQWLCRTRFARRPFIERSRYNRRCRDLVNLISLLRQAYVQRVAGDFKYVIIDSLPMPLCQPVRNLTATRLRDYADIGFNSSKRTPFYGFKFHCLLTNQGFVLNWQLTAASVHDSQVASDLLLSTGRDLVVLGDLGYLNQPQQRDLRANGIILWTPKRSNMSPTESAQQTRRLKRYRKRIETTFSSFTRSFNFEQPGSQTLTGIRLTVETILFTHTMEVVHALGQGRYGFNLAGGILN